MSDKNYYSYATFMQDRQRFRQSGGVNGDEFSDFDFPDLKFFRIYFHFYNGTDHLDGSQDKSKIGGSNRSGVFNSGLLAPAWVGRPANATYDSMLADLWDSPSAWAYLALNDENDRANLLQQFVELLSTISTMSPWYFQSIKGLDAAVERKLTASAEFTIPEERDKITIDCIEDSFDGRIGTLLDLYRSIVWSWQHKRQMLPANLRKFDMTIVLFSAPVAGLHTPKKSIVSQALGSVGKSLLPDSDDYAGVSHDVKSEYVTSYKVFEFHGCEFDYNSAKSGYNEVNNEAGFNQKYSIDISFDDVFESRYNEFSQTVIGDLIKEDLVTSTFTRNADPQANNTWQKVYPEITKDMNDPKNPSKLEERLNQDSTFIHQLVGRVTSKVGTQVDKLVLGNLFGLSIKRLGQTIGSIAGGDINAAINSVEKTVTKLYNGAKQASEPYKKLQDKPVIPESVIKLGNIFQGKTTINNI